jgi:chromosome segregation ATPase
MNETTEKFASDLAEYVCRIANEKIEQAQVPWKARVMALEDQRDKLKAEIAELESLEEPLLHKIEELEADLAKLKPMLEHYDIIANRERDSKRLEPAVLKNVLSGRTQLKELAAWKVRQIAEELILYLQLDLMPATLRQQENAYWERLWHVLQLAPVCAGLEELARRWAYLEEGRSWLDELDIKDFAGLALALADRRRRKLVVKAAKEALRGE